MWENKAGKLAGSVFTRGNWSPDIPFVDVMPGTPVAANVDSDTTPFTIRVWYRNPNRELEKSSIIRRIRGGRVVSHHCCGSLLDCPG